MKAFTALKLVLLNFKTCVILGSWICIHTTLFYMLNNWDNFLNDSRDEEGIFMNNKTLFWTLCQFFPLIPIVPLSYWMTILIGFRSSDVLIGSVLLIVNLMLLIGTTTKRRGLMLPWLVSSMPLWIVSYWIKSRSVTTIHTIRKVKFLSKNSILTKLQHFHKFFTQIFFEWKTHENVEVVSKLNFWTKIWLFE